MEDDVDWDVRIKSQLRDYALTSRALTQPLATRPRSYVDPTYPVPAEGDTTMPPDISFNRLPSTIAPHTSPYGDGWSVLWLGHCGTVMPSSQEDSTKEQSTKIAKGRIVHSDDVTVPLKRWFADFVDKWGYERNNVQEKYPEKTRITHHAMSSTCSLAYAVTQASARRLLYDFAVRYFTDPFDMMLRQICEGDNGRPSITCLTVQPQLFNHHRPVGRRTFESEISDHGNASIELAFTEAIRLSVRVNLERLLEGREDFVDQFPDT